MWWGGLGVFKEGGLNLPDSINQNNNLPKMFNLNQNYPNPFNLDTTIPFRIEQDFIVDIKIYDILGRLIKEVTNKLYQSGTYKLKWDGKDQDNHPVASGLYLAMMKIGKGSITKKIIIIK